METQILTAEINNDKDFLWQAEKFLDNRYNFRNNIVLGKIEISPKGSNAFRIMTSRDYSSLFRGLRRAEIKISVSNIRGLLNSDFVDTYNPFKEYFNSLPEWDGTTDYISALASTVETTNTEFWKECFKRWIVALVGCAIDDTVANHTVLVFSGKQGIGKTTWQLNLVPPVLRDYRYSGNIKPNNKDSEIYLSECLLINLDELEALNRTELGDLKDMITKSVVKLRRPYGYTAENFVRRASFTGSVNKKEFLSDSTGSRRFLCFEVLKIDYASPINHDLVYSQALHLLNSGFKYWFDTDDIEKINTENEAYNVLTVEEQLLMQYCQAGTSKEDSNCYTATELAQYLTQKGKIGLSNSFINSLGKALNKRGFMRAKEKGLYKWLIKKPVAKE